MEFIAHRINRLDDLFKVPKDYGVEVDLRDYDGNIVLQHDPFKDGDNFEKFLSSYKIYHKTKLIYWRICEKKPLYSNCST